MQRTTSRTRVSDTQVRYRTTLESDECAEGTPTARFLQFELLRTLASDPSLTACGYSDFRTLRFEFRDTRWQVVCEALVNEKE
jgi:hypothetical protein